MIAKHFLLLPAVALAMVPLALPVAAEDAGWTPLFNGKDLEGWTPKFAGHELGENVRDTFRVEDGVLKVDYSKYASFDGKFGHLFAAAPYSHYILRLEYRFTGDQVEGGPGWAFRNSGVMIHGQEPSTIGIHQNFPVSIEVQLLGGPGEGDRPTANLCTPGTYVTMNGELVKTHCTESTSDTFHGDQWVTAEIEVHGGGEIIHRVNGKEVLRYTRPMLDEDDKHAKKLIEAGAEQLLTGGSVSLQAESHPVEFRKVEIRKLDPAS